MHSQLLYFLVLSVYSGLRLRLPLPPFCFALSLSDSALPFFIQRAPALPTWQVGPRRGLAQSIYQVGGNTGQAFAPLIAAFMLVPLGQPGVAWFTIVGMIAVGFLLYISRWYAGRLQTIRAQAKKAPAKAARSELHRKSALTALGIIVFLIFARSWYGNAISNFYAFYAIEQYGLTIKESQTYIFLFLILGAIGTFLGGPLADRFGKKTVILISLLASFPLALLLPFAGPVFAYVLLGLIGVILTSSFSVTVVYAQELFPGKIGTMSGLTVGLAFGMGAIGSVALGSFIDAFGLTPTMIGVAFLPILGILAFLLPSDQTISKWNES
nr:MFS transporter [Bacillus pumilus]